MRLSTENCWAGGLTNFDDRLDALGGKLTILSEPGHFTRVSGSLPLPAATRVVRSRTIANQALTYCHWVGAEYRSLVLMLGGWAVSNGLSNGPFYLKVNSDGSWTITVSSP